MAQYISKRSEQQIVVRPTDRTMDEQRRVMIITGKKVTFFDHYFETQDPEIIDFLDRHPQRGKDFDKVREGMDLAMVHKAIKRLKNNESIRVVTGARTTSDEQRATQPEKLVDIAPAPQVPPVTQEVRPETTTLISPELVKLIDDKVNTALATIIDLLKTDTKKEETMLAGKPTKSFKCPYCGEPQPSGFAVGRHKKVCEKRPQ